MAAVRKAQKSDPTLEAVIEYFSAHSHDKWRKRLLQTNPEQKGKPRMRLRGGVMVDVNQPWSKLHPKAQAENKRAARDAFDAVKKFPNDREAASDYVHRRWIARNKGDPSQPKALFKPYARLPEVEKDKDRQHIDVMKQAIAAVRKRPAKKAGRQSAGAKSIKIDAKSWKRLEAAAKALSAALGYDVPVQALIVAGAEAVAGVSKAMASKARAKRA
jgi:hypothetical protein